MATDMNRAYVDDDKLVHRCDGCGGVLEPWDAEPPVIYDCFHALHAGCAAGRDACPRCDTPRRVHDNDDGDQPEQVEEVAAAAAAAASPPVPDSPSDGGCCACACSRRVAELERRLENEKCCALTEATNVVLESELERAQSRLCRIEEMYKKLEEMYEKVEKFVRLCGGKRAREIEDAEETRKKPREDGGSRKERSWFPTGPDRLNQRRLFHGGLFSYHLSVFTDEKCTIDI